MKTRDTSKGAASHAIIPREQGPIGSVAALERTMTISINVDVEPVEIDGKHWVSTRANGRETSRQGPFPDAAAARAAADRRMRRWRKTAGGNGAGADKKRQSNGAAKHLDAKTAVDAASLLDNADFITDFARYGEGILDEKFLRRKYNQFDNSVWEKLGSDERLVSAIEAEKVKRMQNGLSAREKAQQMFVAAPSVLGGILNDNGANARHRIEASKELRTIAALGPESAPATDRFHIVINMGADIETYNKSRSIRTDDPEDISTKSITIDTNAGDAAPQELVAIVAANKQGNNSGGNTL
jgi:hypothetical protein